MYYTDEYLNDAHQHCKANRDDVVKGECGCFYCLKTFDGSQVRQWIRRPRSSAENTALCPYCKVDAVLPATRGLPIEAPEFLRAMRRMWFETTHTADEVKKSLGRESAPPS